MQLGDLGMLLHMLYEFFIVLRMLDTHISECGNVHTDLLIVDNGRVLLDNTRILHLFYVIYNGCLGEMYLPGNMRYTRARVLFQYRKNLFINFIHCTVPHTTRSAPDFCVSRLYVFSPRQPPQQCRA